MVSHEYFEELIPMHALGALSGTEREQLAHHLETCASCRKRYREERAIVEMLPGSVEAVQPSQETKRKLMARIDADLGQQAAPVRRAEIKPAPAEPKRAWFRQPVFAFAVLAIIAILVVGGYLILQSLQSPDQAEIAAILNHSDVQSVALGGTPDAPNARGELFMVPGDSRAVLKVSGLEPLPPDKGYEFWFIRGDELEPSNVFSVNPDGTQTVLVNSDETVENFNAWGVSIEPRAGVTQPTGPIVILGGL